MSLKEGLLSPMGWLALAVCLALISPLLMMDGMFMDGEMYTAVSHNLSIGLGSWWMPYYTDNFHGLNTFHENPPGGTWLLTLFFSAFGSSMYVERFYILCTLIGAVVLIRSMWTSFLPAQKRFWWLPVFFYVLVPTVHWGYRHNMMESTMLLFVLLSVLALRKAVLLGQTNYPWLLLAAFFTWSAFMVKGPASLFLFGAIPAFWLVWRSFSFGKMIMLTFIYVVAVMAGLAVLFVLPVSAESLDNYFFYRTMERINLIPTVTSKFWILGEWLMQFIVPVAVSAVLFLFSRKASQKPIGESRSVFFFFVLIGFFGSAPLMLTSVQRTFYLITSFPFYAMALAILVVGNVEYIENKVTQTGARIISAIALFLCVGALGATFYFAGQPKRDIDMLNDVYIIAEVIGQDQKIAATPKANFEWSMKAYLMRKFQIQFSDESLMKGSLFLLAKKEELITNGTYCKLDLALKEYALYKKCE